MCLDGSNWTPHLIDPKQTADSKLRIKLSGVRVRVIWFRILGIASCSLAPRGSGETIGFWGIGTFFSASFRLFRGAWSAVGEEIFGFLGLVGRFGIC
jgi:hypothetical protein